MKNSYIYILIILINISFIGYAQEISSDYKLLVKIDSPDDLKWGIPSEILMDSTHRFLIIAYDFNPTYIDFYEVENWEMIKRIKIKGYTYFDNSYFQLDENSVYIDRGRNKNKYIKVDLKTFNQLKVHCENVPNGCSYEPIFESKIDYYENTNITIINNDWYILRFNEKETEIYLNKNYEATTANHTP